MDTSEDQVFLFLENHGLNTPFGDLYISDARGKSFSLSLENVIKGNAVDFERVTSLDGTFLVNQYSAKDSKKNHFRKRIKDRQTEKLAQMEQWDEMDMIQFEENKA